MNPGRRLALWGTLLLAAGFIAGVLHLLGVHFAGGDVYPEYSSLRSDPMGTRLLFDSLAAIPGVTAERNFLPLDLLAGNRAAVLLLGCDPESFAGDIEALRRIEAMAVSGHRMVAAMGSKSVIEFGRSTALGRRWHVRFGVDPDKKHLHKLYFAHAEDWRVLDRAGEKVLAIERDFGKGSVALYAESTDFANESTVARDRLSIVTAAIGTRSRIVFDEAHLGISESGSVVGLVLSFRLTGMAAGLALWAAMFLWKSASTFPPPAAARDAAGFSGRTSHSGLLTLLHRHVLPAELAGACWREWLSANRPTVAPEKIARAEEVIATAGRNACTAVLQIQAILSATVPADVSSHGVSKGAS